MIVMGRAEEISKVKECRRR